MKSSIVAASALFGMAVAVKHAVYTETVYETATTTKYATGPSPVPVYQASTPGAFYAPAVESAASAVVNAVPAVDSSSKQAAGYSTSAQGPDSYSQSFLDQHNIHRARHSAPAVQWDANLAAIANTIASTCVYAHDTSTGGISYGQNIGAASDQGGASAVSVITDSMYNGEMPKYTAYGGEPNDSSFGSWGHFTQIVWKSTTAIGCATASCPSGLKGAGAMKYFTVCNYAPAGNFGGRYADNVLAPVDGARI